MKSTTMNIKTVCVSFLSSIVVVMVYNNLFYQTLQVKLPFGNDKNEFVIFTDRSRNVGAFIQSYDGATRASLMVQGANGDVSLHLIDRVNNRGGLGLLAKANGFSSLSMFDTNGKVRAGLTVFPDGSTSLEMKDKDGVCKIQFLVDKDGSANFFIKDREGNNITSGRK